MLQYEGGVFIKNFIELLTKDTLKKYVVYFVITLLCLISIAVVIFTQRKTITVVAEGQKTQFVTYRNTVKDALASEKIDVKQKEKVEPALDAKISDNDTIVIKRAINTKVLFDGKEVEIQSAEEDIDSMFKAEGIPVNAADKIIPDGKTKLSEGMKVEIIRVEEKTITESVQIAFKEIINKDKSLSNTKRKVTQEGVNGEKQVTSSIVYENGKEVSRKVINETVTKQPVDKITVLGAYPSMPVSSSGSIMSYSKVFKAKATAYWAVNGVGRTYTASGRKAVWDPEGYSTIAVDPKVIPYGTKLFVEDYGFAVAADTGTAIKGNTVDVYFNTYKEACDWGLKYVNVYVLE